MTDSDGGGIHLALPGEWAIKKVFEPVLAIIGEDISRLYTAGRDKLLRVATKKVEDIEDGKVPNLRVARDVLWNGAFSEENICAEYFGGVLASSRTTDGKDDSAIQFVDAIKSLSASQLRLHYVSYCALNTLLVRHNQHVNVADSTDIGNVSIWMSWTELTRSHSITIETDPNALWRHGLFSEYRYDKERMGNSVMHYIQIKPSSFGVMLYSAAHNKLDNWLQFPTLEYGSFADIVPPKYFTLDLESLKGMQELCYLEQSD